MSEESLLDIDQKMKDMKAVNVSIQREINSNQLVALELRESIKALENKKDEVRKQIQESEMTLLKRRDEIAGIDNLLDKERKLCEAEKRDAIALRESVSAESAVFQSEKKAGLEALEEARKSITRQKLDLEAREKEVQNAEKSIAAQLEELSKRRIAVQDMELKAQAKASDAEKMKQDAENALRTASKTLDEAKGKEATYNTLLESLKAEKIAFDRESSAIRKSYNEIELRKKELDDKQRDIIIESDKVRTIRKKVEQEIRIASISEEQKESLKKELS